MLKWKKWTPLVLGLTGIALACYYLTKGTPEKPVAQPIAEPSNVPFESYIGGAGLTEPNSENIGIGSHIPGIVRHIAVKVSAKVKKEDPLFIVEDREAAAQVLRAEALVKQREAEWENGKEQLVLSAKLKDAGAISSDERNQRALALEVAKALLDGAKAELQTSRTRLSLHTVLAPIDGVVMAMNLRVGEFAPAGQTSTALLQLGNLNPLHVRVDIDENDAWRFLPDRKAIAFLRGNPAISVNLEFVRVEPFVRPKRSLTGESTERVDTRVLQIIYRFDPIGKPIYAGQQLDIYIESDPLPKVLRPVPKKQAGS